MILITLISVIAILSNVGSEPIAFLSAENELVSQFRQIRYHRKKEYSYLDSSEDTSKPYLEMDFNEPIEPIVEQTDLRKTSKEEKVPYLTIVIIMFLDLIDRIKDRYLRAYTKDTKLIFLRLVNGDYLDFIYDMCDFIMNIIVFPAAEMDPQDLKTYCRELKAKYADPSYFTDEEKYVLSFANDFIDKDDFTRMTSTFNDIVKFPKLNRTTFDVTNETIYNFIEPVKQKARSQYFDNFYNELLHVLSREYPDNFPHREE